MFKLKIVRPNNTSMVLSFPSQEARGDYLLECGFTEGRGAWVHIDGRVAGLYKDSDSPIVKRNCHIQIGGKSLMSRFLGA